MNDIEETSLQSKVIYWDPEDIERFRAETKRLKEQNDASEEIRKQVDQTVNEALPLSLANEEPSSECEPPPPVHLVSLEEAERESLLQTIERLEREAKWFKGLWEEKNATKNEYQQILQKTVVRFYRKLKAAREWFLFSRCGDCKKRKFQTRLYKEHEMYARTQLCPPCLKVANQLPGIKFVSVN